MKNVVQCFLLLLCDVLSLSTIKIETAIEFCLIVAPFVTISLGCSNLLNFEMIRMCFCDKNLTLSNTMLKQKLLLKFDFVKL